MSPRMAFIVGAPRTETVARERHGSSELCTCRRFAGAALPTRRTALPVHGTTPRGGGVQWNRRVRGRVVTSASVSTSSSSSSATTIDRLLKIQNGSDVRGVALDLNPDEPVTLTTEYATAIAAAFVRLVSERTGKTPKEVRIALGRDSRLSGPAILAAAANGIASAGATATSCGVATTPAMFMSTILGEDPFDGAIELTASHLPANRNGLKFFTKEGGAGKADVKQILTYAADLLDAGLRPTQVEPKELDFMATYSAHLVDLIRKGCNHPDHYDTPLLGFKILVDAGNGAGGFFVDRVLKPLGADTTGSQFLDPDGRFPNHIPNPEDTEAMTMTSDAVLKNGADLGIVFDTDVDRSAVVDDRGVAINRNRLIAVLADIVLREHPGSTIVTDSVTSSGLAKFIESRGGEHFRYRRGHGAMKENHMLDDGAYLAVKIIIELAKRRMTGCSEGVAALYKGLEEPKEDSEFRLKFRDPQMDFKSYGMGMLEDLKTFADGVSQWKLAPVNYEGLRYTVDEGNDRKGWFLLRQSLHDPLLALNIESEVDGGVRAVSDKLLQFFARYDQLDASPLKPK